MLRRGWHNRISTKIDKSLNEAWKSSSGRWREENKIWRKTRKSVGKSMNEKRREIFPEYVCVSEEKCDGWKFSQTFFQSLNWTKKTFINSSLKCIAISNCHWGSSPQSLHFQLCPNPTHNLLRIIFHPSFNEEARWEKNRKKYCVANESDKWKPRTFNWATLESNLLIIQFSLR